MKIIKNFNNNKSGFTPTPFNKKGVSLQSKRGFTLLEILLVVAAIAILAGIVIFAINPGKQLADTRNAQRRVDVNTILNAVYQYSVDNKGAFPPTITTSRTDICKLDAVGCTDLIVLSILTTEGKYLIKLPVDPIYVDDSRTGYFISKDGYGHITVDAPYAENGVTISVTQ